jgi:hypothetical protein
LRERGQEIRVREEGEGRVERWDGGEEKRYFRTVVNVQTTWDS